MSFWKNVDYIRECRDISRKELAYKADFSLTSLSTGIKRDSIPSADVAFRISKILNVSIEYLLTGKETNTTTSSISETQNLKYLKYEQIIDDFDKLPAKVQKSIEAMIKQISLSIPYSQTNLKTKKK